MASLRGLLRLWLALSILWWILCFYAVPIAGYFSFWSECYQLSAPGHAVSCILSYVPLYSLNSEMIFTLRLWRFDLLMAPIYVLGLVSLGRWVQRGFRPNQPPVPLLPDPKDRKSP